MHDIKWIRENPEIFDKNIARRGLPPTSSHLLEMDQKHRELLTQVQHLQNRRNEIAKLIGAAKSKGENSDLLVQEANELKEKIPNLTKEAEALSSQLNYQLSILPNLLLDDVPEGKDENDHVCVRTWGIPKTFTFQPKSHYELGESLGLMDFEVATALSGSRFVILRQDLAMLERALVNFMIDYHVHEYGYKEISPPYLVKEHCLFGTGQLPKFAEDQFRTTHDHWLIPTAEVPLTNMVREQILDAEALPLRFVAHTPCFRAEAGAAGRDTRGMIRQHQFHKVELVSITTPEQGRDEHERMTAAAEAILKRLELPYRVMNLCSGDIGSTAQKTYDLEVWLPSENRYREISSCSLCGDYQARRMDARFRQNQEKPRFVYTLNGSGVAVGRALVAILENFQDENGRIHIPAILQPYTRKATIEGTHA